LSRSLLCEFLSPDYNIIEASDGKEALEKIKKNYKKISSIILELFVPFINGYELLEIISSNSSYKNIPVIVTTNNNPQQNEIEVLRLGAYDFVYKPYNLQVLKIRLKNAVEQSSLVNLSKLKYFSEHIKLTGLYNREKFFEVTRQLLKENPNQQFAFVRFDIENFKLINAFFGVEEGDRLLKIISDYIKNFCSGSEKITYGNMGGDVFCVCMPYYSKNQLMYYIEKSREILHQYKCDFELTPCFGIYVIDDNKMDIDVIYNNAILATKKCKGNYVVNYAFYEKSMSKDILKEQIIISSMGTALEKRQFQVHFQPKFDVKSNKPYGAEALVRWIDPEKGMIFPGDFIPIFERNGFISKLDFYVWDCVCQNISKWNSQGKTPMPVSVNVSRVNLYNPNLVDVFLELIKKYNIPAWQLNLEITESAYTQNTELVLQTTEKLQKNGFVVMMDDFGNGYSSLNILKNIPVDVLKIERRILSRLNST
ncbi:MAG: EAL domain-containing protein, partial [Oscillospiraceae bacterium]